MDGVAAVKNVKVMKAMLQPLKERKGGYVTYPASFASLTEMLGVQNQARW